MPARHYQRQQRKFIASISPPITIHKDGMNMTFEMIDSDEGFVQTIGERLSVKYADQQRACEAWALRHSHSIELPEADSSLLHRGPDDRDHVAEMFSGRELGDDSSIDGMQLDLAGDDIGEHLNPRPHHRRRSLVATAFDPENQMAAGFFGHLLILGECGPLWG